VRRQQNGTRFEKIVVGHIDGRQRHDKRQRGHHQHFGPDGRLRQNKPEHHGQKKYKIPVAQKTNHFQPRQIIILILFIYTGLINGKHLSVK